MSSRDSYTISGIGAIYRLGLILRPVELCSLFEPTRELGILIYSAVIHHTGESSSCSHALALRLSATVDAQGLLYLPADVSSSIGSP